jgi:hypothetical protein
MNQILATFVSPSFDRAARSVQSNLTAALQCLGACPFEAPEHTMAGKNKGGREIKKPKQAKKPTSTDVTAVPKVVAGSKRPK